MADEDELWTLEELFWTEGADSARHMTAKGAVFIFPYPVGILRGMPFRKTAALHSVGGPSS